MLASSAGNSIGAFPGQNKRADMLSDGKWGLCDLMVNELPLDLAKSYRPHLHPIYHHSAYPLIYFAPELPAEEAILVSGRAFVRFYNCSRACTKY